MKRQVKLFIAADFYPDHNGIIEVRKKIFSLVETVSNIPEVGIKVNSGLRGLGYQLILDIQKYGLEVFADLKLLEISNSLRTDGALLRLYYPQYLTVSVGATSLLALKALRIELLERTKIFGVLVPSDMTDEEVRYRYGCSLPTTILTLARIAQKAQLDGIIASALWIDWIRNDTALDSLKIIAVAIRPEWSQVRDDDQKKNRIATPRMAMLLGADAIVVGRPIVQADNKLEATLKTLREMK